MDGGLNCNEHRSSLWSKLYANEAELAALYHQQGSCVLTHNKNVHVQHLSWQACVIMIGRKQTDAANLEKLVLSAVLEQNWSIKRGNQTLMEYRMSPRVTVLQKNKTNGSQTFQYVLVTGRLSMKTGKHVWSLLPKHLHTGFFGHIMYHFMTFGYFW